MGSACGFFGLRKGGLTIRPSVGSSARVCLLMLRLVVNFMDSTGREKDIPP